ncbi:MAG: methyltransferase domain-containing protein [Bdellovibrionales bacterium]|nr:methyltransferase domain-containing protein [Bdellovibrionales bacterium]
MMMSNQDRLRINVGCGKTPTAGWRNFDNSPSLLISRYPYLRLAVQKLKVLTHDQTEYLEFLNRNSIEWANGAKQIPVSTASADVIYSSHMLEHLDRNEARRFLKEAYRCLKPNGILRIVVPDLELAVKDYLQNSDADSFVARLKLAHQKPAALSERIKGWIVGWRDHRWMYDGQSLRKLLFEIGFSRVEVLEAGCSLIAEPGD